MCLWHVQRCSECEITIALPHCQPILCNIETCYRMKLDPNCILDKDDMYFLDYHDPCERECPYETCGLVIRFIDCGQPDALSGRCRYAPTDSESEYEP
jgi:hypothetical protein